MGVLHHALPVYNVWSHAWPDIPRLVGKHCYSSDVRHTCMDMAGCYGHICPKQQCIDVHHMYMLYGIGTVNRNTQTLYWYILCVCAARRVGRSVGRSVQVCMYNGACLGPGTARP